MYNIIPICCQKCNSHSLYKYGKDKFGNQKYQCRKCKHQFRPDFISSGSRGAKPHAFIPAYHDEIPFPTEYIFPNSSSFAK